MKATIKVRIEFWSGFNPEDMVPAKVVVLEVVRGDRLEEKLAGSFGGGQILVRLMNAESILFDTRHLSPHNGSTIDLMTNFSGMQVKLRKNEHAMLATQTMDAGTTYTITLLDVLPD